MRNVDRKRVGLTIEEGRGAYPAIKWNGLYFHSRYDPVKEARQIMAAYQPISADVVFFFGWGADYFMNEVLRALSVPSRIYIVPMNMAFFDSAMDHFDYSAILGDRRVTIIRGMSELSSAMEGETPSKPIIIHHSASVKNASVEYMALRDMLEEGLYAGFCDDYWKSVEHLVQENFRRNRAAYPTEQGMAGIFGDFQGRAAVVAGAGPSLKGDLERLPLEGAPVIISVDTAYRVLLERGIKPDFTVSIDHQPTISRFFEGLPSAGHLVYSPQIDPAVVAMWAPERRYMTLLSTDSGSVGNCNGAGVLFCGGSVIHPAVDLAVRLGCDTIYLIGADFSYPDGFSHSEGASNRMEIEMNPLMRQVEGSEGGLVWTSKNLIAYLRELERYIDEHRDIRWVNITGRGARIAQCERLPRRGKAVKKGRG